MSSGQFSIESRGFANQLPLIFLLRRQSTSFALRSTLRPGLPVQAEPGRLSADNPNRPHSNLCTVSVFGSRQDGARLRKISR